MNSKIQMIRILVSTVVPVVDWSYEFYDYTSSEANDIFRRKEPAFMNVNPLDNTVFYISGRY
jgi:hypothetical protein